MAHVLANLVKQTSVSGGASTIALTGAALRPYRAFSSVLSNGDTTEVMVVDRATGAWQAAVYTYANGVLTLVSDRFFDSSTGSVITFATGLKDVYIPPLAERSNNRVCRVVTSGTETALTSRDHEVIVNKTVSAAHDVTLRPSPSLGDEQIVSDGKGDLDVDGGGTIKIRVSGDGGATINGQAYHDMISAYQSTRYRFNGTDWNIVA